MVHKDFGGLTGVIKGEKAPSLKPVKIDGRKLFDYSKIEKLENGDKIIYGIDEIGSIYGLYGKDSEIYNAMADGKVVSVMIEELMKKIKKLEMMKL